MCLHRLKTQYFPLFCILITANIAPNRLYIAKATKPSERMTHISLLSLFQTLGFVLGPAMQAALSPIGEKSEISLDSTFHVDMYAACG